MFIPGSVPLSVCIVMAMLVNTQARAQSIDFLKVPKSSAQIGEQESGVIRSMKIIHTVNGDDIQVPDGFATPFIIWTSEKRIAVDPKTRMPYQQPETPPGIPNMSKIAGLTGDHRDIRNASVQSVVNDFPSIENRSSYFNLLQHPMINADMEIVDYQIVEIDTLVKTTKQSLQVIRNEFDATDDSAAKESAVKKAQAAISLMDESLKTILEPQWGNLQVSLFKSHLMSAGFLETVLHPAIGKNLGISPEQQKALQEQAVAIKAEMDEKLEQIRIDSTAKILAGLNAEQLKKLCEYAGVESVEPLMPTDFVRLYSQLRRAASDTCCGPKLFNTTGSVEPVPAIK